MIEMIGTWLSVSNLRTVSSAKTTQQAMIYAIMNNPLSFLGELIRSGFWSGFRTNFMGHITRACFLMRAKLTLLAYYKTFSYFAKQYKAWIVAGSCLLPELDWNPGSHKCPKIKSKNKLYNTSFSFDPSGNVCNITSKVYPVKDELPFIDRAPVSHLNTFRTPLGNVGVLICADSWYPACYLQLKEKRVDIVTVPIFFYPTDEWDKPWKGYSGFPEPEDVDKNDIGNQIESDMWDKYSLTSRLISSGASYGLLTCCIGTLWELRATGQSKITAKDRILCASEVGKRQLLIQKITHNL